MTIKNKDLLWLSPPEREFLQSLSPRIIDNARYYDPMPLLACGGEEQCALCDGMLHSRSPTSCYVAYRAAGPDMSTYHRISSSRFVLVSQPCSLLAW